MAWTLEDQVDPEALRLWNAIAADPRGASSPDFPTLVALLRGDFPSFCGLLLKVRPKGGGYIIPFLFNQVQRRIWQEIVMLIEQRRPLWFVMLKFRQAGMSTFWDAWLFWQMWRQRDVQCLVVAHQLPTAETMIETMKVFYDELPELFRPELREGNHGASIPRGEVYFSDRRSWCMIHLAKNVDPRGQQATHVLETEFAMYPNPAELNGALLPQLPAFGSEARLRSTFIIESTPKGQNAFFDVYDRAKKGETRAFHPMFFPWFIFDEQYSAEPPPEWRMTGEEKMLQKRLSRLREEEYDGKPVTRAQMYWRRETLETECEGDTDTFDQEYPSDDTSCWLLGSKSVFRPYTKYLLACLDDAKDRAREKWGEVLVHGKPVTAKGPVRVRLLPKLEMRGTWTPITSVDFDVHAHGKWLVWEPPVSGHKYCVGADPSSGLESGDNAVICVIDVTTGRQVAEFVDTMSPDKFALEIAAAGYWYNMALLVPEINNIGYVVLKRLLGNISYPNLFKWPKWDEVNSFTKKRGYETNTRTKQILVTAMTMYIEDEQMAVASQELVSEMSVFECRDEGTYVHYEAQKGKHDDRVMAFGLACAGIDQTPTLLLEFNRSGRKVPSARDLHLAASVADAPLPSGAIPRAVADMIAVKHHIPWNPIGGELIA